jgi:uncharacterized protein
MALRGEEMAAKPTGPRRRPTGFDRAKRKTGREVVAVLDEVVSALRESLGDVLLLVRLFGSQARGDAQADSDVDLLVVVREKSPSIEEALSRAVYDVMWCHDFRLLLSPVVFDEASYRRLVEQGFSFVRNIQREGVDLWKAKPAA